MLRFLSTNLTGPEVVILIVVAIALLAGGFRYGFSHPAFVLAAIAAVLVISIAMIARQGT